MPFSKSTWESRLPPNTSSVTTTDNWEKKKTQICTNTVYKLHVNSHTSIFLKTSQITQHFVFSFFHCKTYKSGWLGGKYKPYGEDWRITRQVMCRYSKREQTTKRWCWSDKDIDQALKFWLNIQDCLQKGKQQHTNKKMKKKALCCHVFVFWFATELKLSLFSFHQICLLH